MSYKIPFKRGDRIVDIGGGTNPLKVEGITVFNVDKRQLPGVDAVRDLEEDFADIGKFDGLVCTYVAEHIGWRKIKQFFRNCYEVLKDGGVAVFTVPDTVEQMRKILAQPKVTLADSEFLFGGQDFLDNVHKVIFSRVFITELLQETGFTDINIYDHPNPDARDMYVEVHRRGGDSLVKLNLGSFTVTFGDDWVNCDLRGDIREHVEAKGHVFKHLDVRQGLPWDDGSVDLITAHHLLEHLTRDEGKSLMGECLRVLKEGGFMRASVPDLSKLAKMYVNGGIRATLSGENEGVANAGDEAGAFWNVVFSGHETMYDSDSLHLLFDSAGFTGTFDMEYGKSRSPVIERETEDSFPSHSLYVEGTKAAGAAPSVRGPVITVEPELELYQRYLMEEDNA